MTIHDAITRADRMCPNTYDNQLKQSWLTTAEAMVRQFLDKFTGQPEITEGQLLMPAPYDAAYVYWLQAQIHFANDEMDEYNNAISMFNGWYDRFKCEYAQDHRPRSFGRFLF